MEISRSEVRRYLRRCIELAHQSHPRVNRPYVGTIVLGSDGFVVGEGYRGILDGTGLLIHAERMALNQADEKAGGGTLITTLEPCVSPPRKQILCSCSELIVRQGIECVIIGLLDNSEMVNSQQGVDYLRRRGVRVFICDELRERIIQELIGSRYQENYRRQS